VQVHPIKPTLKARGTTRLKLTCDEPLSNFALNFKSRRYTKDVFTELDEEHNLVGYDKVRETT